MQQNSGQTEVSFMSSNNATLPKVIIYKIYSKMQVKTEVKIN